MNDVYYQRNGDYSCSLGKSSFCTRQKKRVGVHVSSVATVNLPSPVVRL